MIGQSSICTPKYYLSFLSISNLQFAFKQGSLNSHRLHNVLLHNNLLCL